MPKTQVKQMMMYWESILSLFHVPNLTIISWKNICDYLRTYFDPDNLDKVGGEEAECEEEDRVEDGHGEVDDVLVSVLLRHVVRVDREELEAVVPDFGSEHQGTESEGGDEEEEGAKENVVDPQVDPALHVLPHDVSGGRRYRDVPISRAQVLLEELHCEGLVNRFKRACSTRCSTWRGDSNVRKTALTGSADLTEIWM